MIDLKRFILPTFLAFSTALTVGVPVVRSKLRTGRSGLAFHRAQSVAARVVGGVVGLAHAVLAVFTFGVAFVGAARMGVVSMPVWCAAVGWVGMVSGMTVIVVAQAQMGSSWRIGIDDQPTAPVEKGIYARVRNPIYTGMMLIVVGLALAAPCAWTLLAASATLVSLTLQARLEERHLRAMHGASFEHYASKVGRFVPGVGRLR